MEKQNLGYENFKAAAEIHAMKKKLEIQRDKEELEALRKENKELKINNMKINSV